MKKEEIEKVRAEVRELFREAKIPLAPDAEIEVADLGLNRFRKEGVALVLRVNEPEYCSKWIVVWPGQMCPWHHHEYKKETFFCHSGRVRIETDSETIVLEPGQTRTLVQKIDHRFTAEGGEPAIVEEVSMHDEDSDSIFRDESIVRETTVEG